MSKFWVVFKQEYTQVVKKKSFFIGLIITPVIMVAFMMGPAYLARKKSTSTEHLAIIDQSGMQLGQKLSDNLSMYTIEDTDDAYYSVDQIFELPATDTVRFNQIDDSLKKLLTDSDLKYMIVFKDNVLNVDSNIFMVSAADNIVSYRRFRSQISNILSTERLAQSDVNLPVDSVLDLTRRIDLITKDVKGESISFDKKFLISLVFVMMMYVLIFANGQMVMRSVIDEKNSRIMEVLVSSVSPFQLMMGKILGLGSATLTQVLIWILAGVGIFVMTGGGGDPAVNAIVFNPYVVGYFVVFLITGFLMYSTFFALLGAVVSNEKEAQNFIFLIIMPMMLPVIMGMYIIQQPNSLVSIILSYIPPCIPTMLVTRLNFMLPSLTEYNMFSGILLQANIAVLVMIVSVIGLIWLTSKIFRIGILMYGKRATMPEIIKWVKY